MTLISLAEQLGTSTMTIYRRLKRNGQNIDELRDPSTGELTQLGISTIAALFDGTGTTAAQQDAQQDATPVTEQGATGHNSDVLAVAVLETKLAGAEALIEQLTGERDELRRQLAAALAALAAEQMDRQQERRLLTGAADPGAVSYEGNVREEKETTRRSWFHRLFNRTAP